jgi:hypothetical protein
MPMMLRLLGSTGKLEVPAVDPDEVIHRLNQNVAQLELRR